MNVFSLIKNKGYAYPLTQAKYDKETNKDYPYLQDINNKTQAFALCPACHNPVILVNRIVSQTKSNTLYAKHCKYSVTDLADYDQSSYDDCSLANPSNFDEKIKRPLNHATNNIIKDAIRNHFDLLINHLETAIGITFNEQLLKKTLEDFNSCEGYLYHSIHLYNLPIAFLYVIKSQDLSSCKIGSDVYDKIKTESQLFNFGNNSRFNKKSFYISQKNNSIKAKISFYLYNHSLSSEYTEESVTLCIVEKNMADGYEKTLFEKVINFDGTFYVNTLNKRNKYNSLAKSIIV
ncbi:hypothetical protein [Lonsdalea britannica]|uniref:hypothetical protein n=1 Tax=Lonsdalea britannica TaxID=1082704 RepID=UPI00111C5424|nr:hypothetical protein [Lonsdalea britannica]